MKIRSDFVTNSSSSSFVGITIKLKNREDISIDIEETGEWNEYYLPDFINGMPLRGKNDSKYAGIFVFMPPLRENAYPGYRERDIESLPQLALCLMECTNSEYETAFPGDLFELLFSTYIDSGKAEELYIKMKERVNYLNKEYEEYDEEFFGWIRENIVGYRPDMIISAVKDVEDVGNITSVHVFRNDYVRDSEISFAYENNPDDWEFFDDDHAAREMDYDYVIDFDADSTADNQEKTINSHEKETPRQIVHIDFPDKVFVTTGLSEDEEFWIREQIESRGGILKRNFVVSLNYLIYNPDYDHETVKYTRAKEQIEKGKPVEIITFEDFKNSIRR